jgi:hypothetical protein
MKLRARFFTSLVGVLSLLASPACSDDEPGGAGATGGTGGSAATSGSGGSSGTAGSAGSSASGGSSGQSNEAGTINVQIGGEELATDGFLFPTGSEVTIADGWEIEFTNVLVVIDKITLSENPDKAASDQSQTDAVVAEALGPWAVDVHKEGSVPAAGGEGTATPITTIRNQNKNGNQPFDSTKRYAFGFDIVAASASATKVNFAGDTEAEAASATARLYPPERRCGSSRVISRSTPLAIRQKRYVTTAISCTTCRARRAT